MSAGRRLRQRRGRHLSWTRVCVQLGMVRWFKGLVMYLDSPKGAAFSRPMGLPFPVRVGLDQGHS